MTVQRESQHLCGIAGGDDTGDIAVGIQGQLHLTRLMTLDIIAHHAYLRVVIASLRILVGIGVGTLVLGIQMEHRHRELLHLTLIIANPDDLPGVGREHH